MVCKYFVLTFSRIHNSVFTFKVLSTFCLCCISEEICYMSDKRKIIVCNSLKLCKQSCQLLIQILFFLSSFTLFLKLSATITNGNLSHSQLLYPWKNGQCILITIKLVDSSFFKMLKLQLETCKSLYSSFKIFSSNHNWKSWSLTTFISMEEQSTYFHIKKACWQLVFHYVKTSAQNQ